ncbi:hypothetical protein D0C36_20550 [Mucilaginibacter conchicola]|uniref:Uncharacterized protein n=1 Tax=Mucilaginibacter conchicola TaxID=2303333 RepID=A0A372NQU1_9SPHI|nr:hypothetical protein D0C36_20550 [Mucilaginibacter conchicola]
MLPKGTGAENIEPPVRHNQSKAAIGLMFRNSGKLIKGTNTPLPVILPARSTRVYISIHNASQATLADQDAHEQMSSVSSVQDTETLHNC